MLLFQDFHRKSQAVKLTHVSESTDKETIIVNNATLIEKTQTSFVIKPPSLIITALANIEDMMHNSKINVEVHIYDTAVKEEKKNGLWLRNCVASDASGP